MSRRPDAKTVKITEKSLNVLKEIKENFNETSYSQSTLKMWKVVSKYYNTIPSESIVGENAQDEVKDKTIVLSREAHVILNNIKYDKYLRTISDAIEWLCTNWKKGQNSVINNDN